MQYISNINLNSHFYYKQVAIFGCTGSIGQSTLEVIRYTPELFRIYALAAGKNIELLAEQAIEFRPEVLAIQSPSDLDKLKNLLPSNYKPEIYVGKEGYKAMAQLPEVDTVLSAQVGAAGLEATVYATLAGKTICLANKESLVLAGDLIRYLAKENKAIILPVDSEHYALFQCILSQAYLPTSQDNFELSTKNIKRLILTASGGPFRGKDKEFLETVTKEQALKHPNWNMGAKISIDSATLMNKGLEIIEACHLFGLPIEKIEAVLHPQSIVHSLVEWRDASLLAQLALPDMKLPIGACLAFPKMLEQRNNGLFELDLTKQNLSFEQIDYENFPCLNLAKKAFKENLCIELNGANEVAVDLFLKEKISFTQIPKKITKVLEKSSSGQKIDFNNVDDALQIIFERDQKARELALQNTE